MPNDRRHLHATHLPAASPMPLVQKLKVRRMMGLPECQVA
jgi:hypothetical protein